MRIINPNGLRLFRRLETLNGVGLSIEHLLLQRLILIDFLIVQVLQFIDIGTGAYYGVLWHVAAPGLPR
jgi:hypothetical protein